MNDWPDYKLIDFGDGRKLERLAGVVVDRPCPAAQATQRSAANAWADANARYTGDRVDAGKWRHTTRPAEDHAVQVPLGGDHGFRMHLEFTPAGQVGLFPEQFVNWRWIARRVQRAAVPCKVLNLFAYTGGSTLAAACAGAHVTHVDASRPAVTLARRNAQASGLADAPIRWIVEDAVRYCQRELKRGAQYDAVILDPPSYGHGPQGEAWKFTRDLPKLLGLVGELTKRTPRLLLATCHTPGVGVAELGAYLADGVFGSCAQPPATGALSLTSDDGRHLPSGVYARWPG